jgi:hypothetical protein
MLDPDDRHALVPRLVDERADVRDDSVTGVGFGDDTVLDIDHHQRGVGSLGQRGHDALLL